MRKIKTDIANFRESLATEIDLADDIEKTQQEFDQWKAMSFLNAVEVKQAWLTDNDNWWDYQDLMRNAAALNELSSLVRNSHNDIIELLATLETTYSETYADYDIAYGLRPEIPTVGEEYRYIAFNSLARVLYPS